MRIYLQKSFQKKFKKLPEKIQVRAKERLSLFLVNPQHSLLNDHSIDAAYPDHRSINITGDYRAIYGLQKDIAVFISIGTHSELYG